MSSHLAKGGPKYGSLTFYPAIDLLLAIRTLHYRISLNASPRSDYLRPVQVIDLQLAIRILHYRISLYAGSRVDDLRPIPPLTSRQPSEHRIIAFRQMRAQRWVTYALSRHRPPVSHPNIILSHLAKCEPKDGLLTVYPAIDLLLAIRILYYRISPYVGPKDGSLTIYSATRVPLAIRPMYYRISLNADAKIDYLRTIPPPAFR